MPTIYYIRHGETDWNATGRFQGTQDIPLNDKGRAQAVAAGGRLGATADARGPRSGVSGLCRKPARPRPRHHGIAARRAQPAAAGLRDRRRLREITYGAWEGFTLAQMQQSDPQIHAARNADRWNVAPLRGESYASRLPFITDWVGSLTADTVAVGHVGTCRTLLVALGIKSPADALEGQILQGAVYEFRDGGLTIFRGEAV